MALRSHISPDVFLHLPTPANSSPSPSPSTSPHHLIFLLPGNPGLLSYYTTFLSLLASCSAYPNTTIAGFSLGGFESPAEDLLEEDDELLFPESVATLRSGKLRDGGGTGGQWWGLAEQVQLAVGRVDGLVGRVRRQDGEGRVKVTLVGHSVGAYLALEVVRAVSERRERGDGEGMPVVDAEGVLGIGSVAGKEDRGRGSTEWEVEACVLLTPTIMHLARSASGVRAAPLLGKVAFVPWLLQWATWGLTWGLSEGVMRAVVARVMGLSSEEEGVKTTVQFLRSEGGVRQALEMAKEELVTIANDNWGPEVWGHGETVSDAAWSGQGGPQLFFLFAKKDHWVADKTRDEIRHTRGRKDDWGSFHVDEQDGLLHAWCLNQSQLVSEYVKPWLAQIRKGGTQPP